MCGVSAIAQGRWGLTNNTTPWWLRLIGLTVHRHCEERDTWFLHHHEYRTKVHVIETAYNQLSKFQPPSRILRWWCRGVATGEFASPVG